MIRWYMGAVAVILALAVVPARADEKSHRGAAEELLKLMDMDKLMQTSIDALLNAQIKANPAMARYRDVMKKFFAKHMSYASLKEDLIKLYSKEFTEEELRDAIRFYKTPTGRKFLKKAPLLMQKGGELGMRRLQDNIEELKKMIKEAMKDDK
jgi:hypothetical protein